VYQELSDSADSPFTTGTSSWLAHEIDKEESQTTSPLKTSISTLSAGNQFFFLCPLQ
jgi:hypothetical protein